MAPELLEEDDNDDISSLPTKASDIYAFAMVIWQVSAHALVSQHQIC